MERSEQVSVGCVSLLLVPPGLWRERLWSTQWTQRPGRENMHLLLRDPDTCLGQALGLQITGKTECKH